MHEFHARNRNTVNCRRLNRILNTFYVHITKRNNSKRGKIGRNDSKALKRDSVELANESFAIRCIELEFCWMFRPIQSCSMEVALSMWTVSNRIVSKRCWHCATLRWKPFIRLAHGVRERKVLKGKAHFVIEKEQMSARISYFVHWKRLWMYFRMLWCVCEWGDRLCQLIGVTAFGNYILTNNTIHFLLVTLFQSNAWNDFIFSYQTRSPTWALATSSLLYRTVLQWIPYLHYCSKKKTVKGATTLWCVCHNKTAQRMFTSNRGDKWIYTLAFTFTTPHTYSQSQKKSRTKCIHKRVSRKSLANT